MMRRKFVAVSLFKTISRLPFQIGMIVSGHWVIGLIITSPKIKMFKSWLNLLQTKHLVSCSSFHSISTPMNFLRHSWYCEVRSCGWGSFLISPHLLICLLVPSFSLATQKLMENLGSVFLMQYKVWPVVNFVNFKFVPERLRVLTSNVLSVFWNAYLCTRLA